MVVTVAVAVAVVVVVIQFHVTGDGTRAPIFLYKFQFHGRCGGGEFFERLVRVVDVGLLPWQRVVCWKVA